MKTYFDIRDERILAQKDKTRQHVKNIFGTYLKPFDQNLIARSKRQMTSDQTILKFFRQDSAKRFPDS